MHAINATPDVRGQNHLILKGSNKKLSTNFPEFNLINKSIPDPTSNRLVN